MISIVLDPGHGGPSSPSVVGGSSWNNATGPTGLLEKTVTLQVAKSAALALAGLPAKVLLTRTTDVNLGIVARASVAKSRAAEVFVSIHFNAPDPNGPAAQGTETWISPSPSAQSRRLAQEVQTAVVAATGYRDRGVKNNVLVSGVVNNANHSPKTAHCLVEISFLSRQPAEEERLRTPDYIESLGRAVRDGIVSYCVKRGFLVQEMIEVADFDEAEDAASARRLGLLGEVETEDDHQSEEPISEGAALIHHDESYAETYVCQSAGEDGVEDLEEAAGNKPPVNRRETTSHKSSRNGTDIDHIVIHYTTSRNIEGSIRHFKTGRPRTSAHYIIGRDGTLVQMVSDSENAWHSGRSEMNRRSIGIEHVAALGDKITEAQSRTSIALIQWLMAEYGVPLANVIPHVCVKPTSCCGDLFKDFGGGADLSCAKQRTALHRWMATNGIGAESALEHVDATDEAMFRSEEVFTEAATPVQRIAMGQAIVRFEARRDSKGRIKVYRLPSIDGGGAFEVAGINVRYHHDQAWALRRLIEAGRHAEAEALACEYIAQYTDRATRWCSNSGVEFYLRDCIFNRGPTGAAKILQRALKVPVDGLVGSQTLSAVVAAEEASPQALLQELRVAREAYEREVIGIRPQFKAGLENRWNNALSVAKSFL